MKRKKGGKGIYVCILLIILAIMQLVYFNNRDAKNDRRKNEVLKESKSEGIIFNADELYKYYSEINISKKELEKNVYKFITQDLSDIRRDTIGNTASQNMQYYVENKNKIDNIGIRTENDFILIAEELKNCTNSNDIEINEIKLEVEEEYLDKIEDYRFNIIIKYTNSASSNIRCVIPINNIGNEKLDDANNTFEKIYYESNSEIAKIFSTYNGPVNITEFLEVLNTFKNNIATLSENTKWKSINEISRIYDDNKEFYRSIGIVNSDDFNEIVYTINNEISWKNDDEPIYTIDINESKEQEMYTGHKLTFIYNYVEEINFMIYFNDILNELPRIKISGVNGGI